RRAALPHQPGQLHPARRPPAHGLLEGGWRRDRGADAAGVGGRPEPAGGRRGGRVRPKRPDPPGAGRGGPGAEARGSRRPRASVEPGPAGAPSRRPRPAADPLSEPESLQVHRLLGAGGGRPRPRQLGRDGSREEARLETSFGDGSPGRCRRAPAAARWSGRILSGLAVAFLLFDAAVKLLELPVAVEGTTRLGY